MGSIGDDDVAAGGPAPGFGPVGLGLDRHESFVKHGGFGQDDGRGDDPLAAGT